MLDKARAFAVTKRVNDLRNEGRSDSEIAKMLGMYDGSIAPLRATLSLEREMWLEAVKAEIKLLKSQGLSEAALRIKMATYGVTKAAMDYYLSKGKENK